jgi:hypothetical protein
MTSYLDFTPDEHGEWRFPPGIYFGMPDEVYHADKSLGSTSIKALAIDPYEFQFDRLYGEDKDSDAIIFGQALHARILEGRAAFEAKFCKEFDKADHPDALVTVDDLKKWLDKHGMEKLGGKSKGDLIALVRNIDPEQPVFDLIKAKWEKETEGRTPLKPKRWAQVEVAAKWVQRDPLLSAVMEDGTFSHGAPEVSIFYEDRGVRLKCRFDRFMRHAILDLKSFAPIFGGRIDGSDGTAIKTIARMRYDLQEATYRRGWHHAKDLNSKGLVYGDPPHPTFLDECFDREQPKWIWIMVKTKGAPQPLVIEWDAKFAMEAAAQRVEEAIDQYVMLRDDFGDDQEWPPMRPAMHVTDADLPAFFGRI